MISANEVQYDPELCHVFCRGNREAVRASNKVGCFYCTRIVAAKGVTNFRGDSALCPHCGQDCLIPDSEVPLLDQGPPFPGGYVTCPFISRMNNYWFGGNGRRRPA